METETNLQRTKDAIRQAQTAPQEKPKGLVEAYNSDIHADSSLDCYDSCHGATGLDIKCPPTRFLCSRYTSEAPKATLRIKSGSPISSRETMSVPGRLKLSSRRYRLLLESNRHPPVTKQTLSELDLQCITCNINLRMDANFDRDLHFKPDLDGEKGRRKRMEAADYWEAVATEIFIYQYYALRNLVGFDSHDRDDVSERRFLPRLPTMLETLQDILKTLVPECDHPSVMQNIDVPSIMKQIREGVFDMVELAKWLSAVLKSHCAPMRDEWADRMVEQISLGSESQNHAGIVSGLQTLFAILEAMKLDVANHQIRAFRVVLVESTIPFLQRYFRAKIDRDGFQVESSRSWYLGLRAAKGNGSADSFQLVSTMLEGLADMLLQFDYPEVFPETFIFDSERLWQLREAIQNLINIDICWYISESYIRTQKRYSTTPAEIYPMFRSRIWSLMEGNESWHRTSLEWQKNIGCLALEIARFVCVVCHGSGVVLDEVLTTIETAVEWHLTNESELFLYFQGAMRKRLLEASFEFTKKYLDMSPLTIYESQRGLPALSLPQSERDIERTAMRLAHIGTLHWRVWAPILYLRQNVEDIPIDDMSLD